MTAVGVGLITSLGIMIFLAFGYLFSILIANMRLTKISAREIALLVIFMSAFSMLVAFVIAGDQTYSLLVLSLTAVFGVFLFVSRVRRFILDGGRQRDVKREEKRSQGEILRLR